MCPPPEQDTPYAASSLPPLVQPTKLEAMLHLAIAAFLACSWGRGGTYDPDESRTPSGDDSEPSTGGDCEETVHSCSARPPCVYGEPADEDGACADGWVAVDCSGWLYEDAYFSGGIYCLTEQQYADQLMACGGNYDCEATVGEENTAFSCSWVNDCLDG